VRWTRTVNLAQGIYRFTVFADDGARLFIDDQLRLTVPGTNTVNVQLFSSGDHKIVLEFFENFGNAAVSLSWGALLAPSNLVASPLSSTQISLSWNDNSAIEDGFKIERWNGSSYSQIATVGADVRTYVDSGLPGSTTFSYQVRAYNSAGDSGYSNVSSATTAPCSYALSPAAGGFGPNGGTGSITVLAAAGCPWSVGINSGWVQITSGGSGNGNGTVTYSVNPWFIKNGARSTTLTIGDRTFRISQDGPITCCD
jgi:hypothetical protein